MHNYYSCQMQSIQSFVLSIQSKYISVSSIQQFVFAIQYPCIPFKTGCSSTVYQTVGEILITTLR